MSETPSTADALSDRLTIGRLMLLTAGVAFGLSIFMPGGKIESQDLSGWAAIYSSAICGLALPAPLFCLSKAWRKQPLGAGGLFALVAGLAVVMFAPAAIVEWVGRQMTPTNNRNDTIACLYFLMPLMALWHTVAACATGYVTRLFKRDTPWTERYGLVLALLWTPIGAWHFVAIYRDALKP